MGKMEIWSSVLSFWQELAIEVEKLQVDEGLVTGLFVCELISALFVSVDGRGEVQEDRLAATAVCDWL